MSSMVISPGVLLHTIFKLNRTWLLPCFWLHKKLDIAGIFGWISFMYSFIFLFYNISCMMYLMDVVCKFPHYCLKGQKEMNAVISLVLILYTVYKFIVAAKNSTHYLISVLDHYFQYWKVFENQTLFFIFFFFRGWLSTCGSTAFNIVKWFGWLACKYMHRSTTLLSLQLHAVEDRKIDSSLCWLLRPR